MRYAGSATRYLTTDHLGSASEITNEVGVVTEAMSYDVFGAKRDPGTWNTYAFGSLPNTTDTTDQGYTGQQQLDALGLVHMNGRVQDPYTGRFVSADPTVPDPGYSQAFNRFAYVYNNPMNSVDPSGFACTTQSAYGSCSASDADGISCMGNSCVCVGASCLNPQHTTVQGPPPTRSDDDQGPVPEAPPIAPAPVNPVDPPSPPSAASSTPSLPQEKTMSQRGTEGVGNFGNGLCISGSCDGNGVLNNMDITDGATTYDGGVITGDSGGSLDHIMRNTQAPQLPNNAGGGGPTVGPNRNGTTGSLGSTANPTGGAIRPCGNCGCGYFRASRDGGSRPHLGTDYLGTPGQPVAAVIGGTITKIGYPYANDLSFHFLQISGLTGLVAREMYVNPAAGISIGTKVNAGDVIGTEQDLSKRYPGIPNHIHVEIRLNGNPIDPASILPP